MTTRLVGKLAGRGSSGTDFVVVTEANAKHLRASLVDQRLAGFRSLRLGPDWPTGMAIPVGLRRWDYS